MIKPILVLFLCLFYTAYSGTFYQRFHPLAKEIISHMSLQQKIGQTVQSDFEQFNKRGDTTQYEQIKSYSLGSVLVGGNGCPDGNGNLKIQSDYSKATQIEWKKVADLALAQTTVISSPDGPITIPILLGTDAVHGNQHVIGTILFPHNIGLASSHDPQNFGNSAKWNALGVKASGFNFAFAPTVAISHNPQWGRFYETMGDNVTEVQAFAKAYVIALQGIEGGYLTGVLGSTKHFLGDGATINGNDQGNTKVYNMKAFLDTNLAGYKGALEAKIGNIMVSYSAINDIAMSINQPLLQGLLKEDNEFDGRINNLIIKGFLISDYDAIGKVAYQGLPTSGVKMDIKQAYLMTLNAGMDMIMQIPKDDNEVSRYLGIVQQLLDKGTLRKNRLDDAVMRILGVKLAMQLIQVPETLAEKYAYENKKIQSNTNKNDESISQSKKESTVNSEDEYQDALKAAQESLILLKNDANLLPLNKKTLKYIVLAGEIGQSYDGVYTNFQNFDNIGMQCGGWSIRWQGYHGNQYWMGDLKTQSRATSLLDGILDQTKDTSVTILRIKYNSITDWDDIGQTREKFLAKLADIKDMTAANTVIIGVFGESPYAEFMGEINSEYCIGTTKYVEGCGYNSHINEYMPDQQKVDLKLSYDQTTLDVIQMVQKKGSIPLISVLFSGRPMLVQDTLDMSSSFIAAWLPGTTGGQALANSIFGTYLFGYQGRVNTLPVPWISTQESLKDYPIYDSDKMPEIVNPLFPSGYGLSTTLQIKD